MMKSGLEYSSVEVIESQVPKEITTSDIPTVAKEEQLNTEVTASYTCTEITESHLISSLLPEANLDNNEHTTKCAHTEVTFDLPNLKIIIQGIEIPLSTPLYELWYIFAHPDLFLYVIIL